MNFLQIEEEQKNVFFSCVHEKTHKRIKKIEGIKISLKVSSPTLKLEDTFFEIKINDNATYALLLRSGYFQSDLLLQRGVIPPEFFKKIFKFFKEPEKWEDHYLPWDLVRDALNLKKTDE